MVQLDREIEGAQLFFCSPLIARRLPNDPLRKLYENPEGEIEDTETVPEPPDWVSILENMMYDDY